MPTTSGITLTPELLDKLTGKGDEKNIQTSDDVSKLMGKLGKKLSDLQEKGGHKSLEEHYNRQLIELGQLYDALKEYEDAIENALSGESKTTIENVKQFREIYLANQEKIKELENERASATHPEDIRIIDDKIQDIKDTLNGVRDTLAPAGTAARAHVDTWYTSGSKKVDDELLLRQAIHKHQEEAIRLSEQTEAIQEESNAALEAGIKKWEFIKKGVQAVWTEVKRGANAWLDYNEQAVSDAKKLGITTTEAVHAYGTAMMETSKSLIRDFGMTMEEAMKMQETFGQITSKAALLGKNQLEDVAAASSLMGKENIASAIQIMDTMGSTTDRAVELMDKNYARAKNSGLDTAKAAEAFVQNMTLANKMTFKNGVDGISKMTMLSQRLKFNLQDVANVAEKFSSIEGSIEGAAQLQMLGGSGAIYGANPMQMMYEALNDGEAFTERLTKVWSSQATFDRKTGEADIPAVQKQIIKAQAQAMGMNADEAMNIAKNQAKLEAFNQDNRQLAQYLGGTPAGEEKLAALQNKSQYTSESGWTITYVDKEGQQQTKTVQEVAGSSEIMDEVLADQLDTEEDIKNNVRKIAQELISLRQEGKSLKDLWATSEAQVVDTPMQMIDDTAKGAMRQDGFGSGILDFATGGKWWNTGLTVLGYGLGVGATAWAANKFLAPFQNNMLGRLGGGAGAGGGVGGSTAAPGGGGGPGPSPRPTPGGGPSGGGSGWWSKIRGGLGRAGSAIKSGLGRTGSAIANATKTVWNYGGRALSGVGGKVLGGAASTAVGAFTAYQGWQNANEKQALKQNQTANLVQRGRISQAEQTSRNAQAENKATREKSMAVGEGIGQAIGGTIGTSIGGAIGMAIGGPVGAAIGGSLAGAALGYVTGLVGKGVGYLTSKYALEKDEGVLGEHIKDIEDGDADDNIKKIVLPVESIDYNVALIANQLGVMSAMPARGNIYLEQEAESEGNMPQVISLQNVLRGNVPSAQAQQLNNNYGGNIETQNMSNWSENSSNMTSVVYTNASDVVAPPIQASTVLPTYVSNNYSNGNTGGQIDWHVSGEINLKLDGKNCDLKLTANDLMKMIKSNPSVTRELAEIITGRQASNGNAGRNNRENADNRRSTTSNTYTGGL